jgi:gluconolactonase
VGCYSVPPPVQENTPMYLEERTDFLDRADPRLDDVIDPDAVLQVLADGFEWTEGPVWLPNYQRLLFSDIPTNTIYAWSESEGLEVYLRPAGYNRDDPAGMELGTNGLMLDTEGRLVMSNHGLRALTRLNEANFTHTVLVDRFEGKRLNSPNDLDIRSNGDIYFTDPSYGLEGVNESPHKELDFNGVYRLTPAGELTLLTREFTNPNGTAFSPDESVLYVAQSDESAPIIRAFDVMEDGSLANSRLFYDASSLMQSDRIGVPDGMVVSSDGHVFATGPGGVMILTPEGDLLGTILTGEATANCTFGDDGSTLYITADMYLMRIDTKVRGIGF